MVGSRRAKVIVDDDDGYEYRDDVHEKREEEVLGDQRYRQRRRRQDLRDEQQEDDQSQQDRDAHRHLLERIGREEEDADAEEGDEDAGDDEVDRVEERLAADLQGVRDLRLVVSLRRVPREVVDTRTRHDVPRAAVDVIAQVDLLLAVIPVQLHLISVEGPRTELHLALLLVEGKVLDVYRARALVDGRWYPEDGTSVLQDHVRLVGDLVFPVCAVRKHHSATDSVSVRVQTARI